MKTYCLIIQVLFCGLFFVYDTSAINRCAVSPRWRLKNVDFPNDFANVDVKLVAFLKASCGFCRTQSTKLGELRDELIKSNFTRIAFLIINSHHKDSYNKLDVFQNITTIPTFQDQHKVNVWKRFSAETDDMLIFDKCNKLVFHLQLPDSIVTNGKVKESIIQAFNGTQCGKTCSKSKATTKKSNANIKKIQTTTQSQTISKSN